MVNKWLKKLDIYIQLVLQNFNHLRSVSRDVL